MSALPAARRFEIMYVYGHHVEHCWSRLYDLIAPACDETMSPALISEAIYNRKAIAWCVVEGDRIRAAAVTQKKTGPTGVSHVAVLTLGGEGSADWGETLRRALEDYCVREDCAFIRAYCRRGLGKWLKDMGWRERQVVMEWRGDG